MRHRVVVLLAALAIFPAGCGGEAGGPRPQDGASAGGRAAYAATVNAAQDALAKRLSRVQEVGATSTPAEDRRILQDYVSAISATARRLGAMPVPAGLGPLHRQLVAGVRGYGATLGAIRASIDDADGRTALAAQTRLSRAVPRAEGRIGATIRAINRKLGG